MINTFPMVFALGQTTNSSDATAAGAGIVGGLIGALVGALIGGLLYGAGLMLLSGPIGKVKVGFGPAFKTMFAATLIAGIIGVLVTAAIGLLGSFVQLALFFVLSTLMISKNHGISTGRAAGISGILLAIAIVVGVIIGVVMAAVLLAAGAAGAR